jgi:hypothetical protein
MATPKPGEIRCPTCHRSTPPAAFCTQCGSAIPSDARIRPRGMDRDELQDRIRQRRSGGDPYRRGGVADEGAGGYQRFEPEPEDSQARRSLRPGEQRRDAFDEEGAAAAAAAAAAAGAAPVEPSYEPPDITREADDWTERPSLVPPLPPSEPIEPAPPPFADERAYVDNYDDAADDAAAYPYEYDDWDDGRQRRSSGAGAFAILGFLALGVLALFAGAVLAGVFSSDPGVGGVDPTLTPIPSTQESTPPSESASTPPSSDASTSPSSSPTASGEPVVFPDGFTAEAQPCIPGSASTNGCGSNASSNSGSVWIWVGFAKGTSDDVIGAEIIGPDGDTVGTGSIDLASIRCGRSCNGWTYFQFGNLDAGTYEVRITRNGDLAAETSFEVT